QHVLVEDDLAPRDLPLVSGPAQHVLALADQDVGLGLDPVAVDQKAAAGGDLPRLVEGRRRLGQLDIGDEVRDARLRLLGPVYAGLDLPDPTDQRLLALVEPGDVLAL